MSTIPAVPAPFLDPKGISCPKVISDAGIIAPTDALVSLLVANGAIPIPKLRGQYGYMLTAKQAAKFGPPEKNRLHPIPSGTTDPGILEFKTWNDPSLTWEARTEILRTENVAGILVVIRHWNSTLATYGSPIIRLVAAPALATYPHTSIAGSGSVLSDIWDPLPESLATLRVTSPVTPVLVSSGGFPRPLNTPTFSTVLESVQGLILHSVEDLVTPISLPDGSRHVRCWMFPAGTNLPIGLAWTLSEAPTFDAFQTSVKAVHKSAYSGFLQHLANDPAFDPWLEAAFKAASHFNIYGIPLADLTPVLPPLIATDPVHPSIACTSSISSWVDMRYLFVWRHVVDIMGSQIKQPESDCLSAIYPK